MALIIDDLPSSIRQAKKELRVALPNYSEVFAEVEEAIIAEAKRIAAQRDRGEDVIPEIQFSDITERTRDRQTRLQSSRHAAHA
jgi:hypothetical protein